MQETKRYRGNEWLFRVAKFSNKVRLVSIVYVLHAMFVASVMTMSVNAWVGCIAFIILVGLAVMFSPAGYGISPDDITIYLRGIPKRRLSLKDIKEIRISDYNEVFKGAWFMNSSAHIFGFVGYGNNSNLEFASYCTRTDRIVLIKPKQGVAFVISPADPQDFVETANRMLEDEGQNER